MRRLQYDMANNAMMENVSRYGNHMGINTHNHGQTNAPDSLASISNAPRPKWQPIRIVTRSGRLKVIFLSPSVEAPWLNVLASI